MADVKITDSSKAPEIQTVPAIECLHCKKLHRIESDTYVVFKTGVYIGEHGGVTGPGDTAFCRSLSCLGGIYTAITPEYAKIPVPRSGLQVDLMNLAAHAKLERFEKPADPLKDIYPTSPVTTSIH